MSIDAGTADVLFWQTQLEQLLGEVDARSSVNELEAWREKLNDLLTALREAHASTVEGTQQLLDFLHDGYLVTDADTRIRALNEAAATFLLTVPAVLLQRPLQWYLPAAEQPKLSEALTRAAAQDNTLVEWETSLARADDAPSLPVVLRVAPLRYPDGRLRGYQWLIRTSTRHTRQRDRGVPAPVILQELIDTVPLGLVLLDTEGQVRQWSQGAAALLGWSRADVEDQHLQTLPPALQEPLGLYLYPTPSPVAIEAYWQHQDGTPVPIRLVAAPFYDEDGQRYGTIALLEDRKEYQRWQRHLSRVQAELATSRALERQRLGRDLHDGVVQQMVGAQLYLKVYREKLQQWLATLGDVALPDLPELAVVEKELATIGGNLREVISILRPVGLETMGLAAALERVSSEVQAQSPGMPFPELVFRVEPSASTVSPAVQTTVVRVVKEALRNVVRHAAATQVEVTLEWSTRALTLSIQDNGRGTTLPSLPLLAQAGHYGLVGVQELVDLVQGQVDFRTQPGQGMQWVVTIPLGDEAADASLP